MPHSDDLNDALDRLDAVGLRRHLTILPQSGGAFDWDGVRWLNFSSNDYLNLANDSRVKQAAKDAVDRYGCGATSSRLMAGHLEIHAELEAELANLTRQYAALAFPSGYQANLGAITTIAQEGDILYSDALNHASLIDGCRLSRARVEVYRHTDLDHLESLLREAPAVGRRVILTDTVFSMDGDLAPLVELRALADRYDAFLLVDEAHALGIYGGGGGLCVERGVQPDGLTANLSKALGSGGGFVAGSAGFIDLLVNRARGFIFSTGLSPACAGAAFASARIVQQESDRGPELLRRAQGFRAALRDSGVSVPDDASPIVPIVLGSNEVAMEASQALFEQHLYVSAIRPPSVPEGASRLRVSVTLAHEAAELARAAQAIASVLEPAPTK